MTHFLHHMSLPFLHTNQRILSYHSPTPDCGSSRTDHPVKNNFFYKYYQLFFWDQTITIAYITLWGATLYHSLAIILWGDPFSVAGHIYNYHGGPISFPFCSLHLGRYSNDIPVHNVDFMTIGLLSTAKMGGDDGAQTDLLWLSKNVANPLIIFVFDQHQKSSSRLPRH